MYSKEKLKKMKFVLKSCKLIKEFIRKKHKNFLYLTWMAKIIKFDNENMSLLNQKLTATSRFYLINLKQNCFKKS